MKKSILFVISLTVSAALSATTINFSAGVANNIAGVNGAALSGIDLISAGTWDGSSFTSLASASNDNIDFGPGFFSHSFGPVASTAGAQLAFSWSTAGANTGIVYYDIAAGDSVADQWTLKGGNGSGSDFNANAIDLSDLATSASGYTALSANAVLINVELSGTNAAGVPSFNLTAVPEPSAYAALAGILALGCVMLRRRA